MNTKRIIIAIIAVVAIAAGLFGLSEYQRGHEEMAGQKADFSVATDAILAEFTTDNAAANQKYLGKVVQVTGVVASVKPLDGGGTNVVLQEGANCSFQEEVTLEVGNRVNIKGECTGFMEEEMLDLLEVNLTRCTIVE